MSVIGGLGSFGVAAFLVTLLMFGTGKNAGKGKMPELGWGAVFGLSLLAGSGLAAAGDPLKFRSIVQDILGVLNDVGVTVGGGRITMAGLAVILLSIILYRKQTTRTLAVVTILFSFAAGSSGGSLAVFMNMFDSIVSRIS
ncbi:hypothetical protein GCM10010387_16020 [Streptomyces inusitatus]|uniref:Uncharacterized protein n=1 Tax=Streptomyces inusitatus TaxID=68221 RepID=A0A918UNW7_9ACTN|nr:hypothetical protein [Streptomyces inusitatus]GGZ23621.1 hypothetical protein GCM10010387_16020 [Streptomyces inusitatus]